MDIKKAVEKVAKSDKKLWYIFAIGLLGMALILFSRNSGENKDSTGPPKTEQTEAAADTYAEKLENKIINMVKDIEGVGDVRVMITMANSGEYVYITEEKIGIDKAENTPAGESSKNLTQKESIEKKYVMVENENGRKQALIKTWIEPSVQGVVIICQGADDIKVKARVINVVTTALNIPSTRVCVEKLSS